MLSIHMPNLLRSWLFCTSQCHSCRRYYHIGFQPSRRGKDYLINKLKWSILPIDVYKHQKLFLRVLPLFKNILSRQEAMNILQTVQQMSCTIGWRRFPSIKSVHRYKHNLYGTDSKCFHKRTHDLCYTSAYAYGRLPKDEIYDAEAAVPCFKSYFNFVDAS